MAVVIHLKTVEIPTVFQLAEDEAYTQRNTLVKTCLQFWYLCYISVKCVLIDRRKNTKYAFTARSLEKYLKERLFLARQPLVGQGLLITEVSRSHSDTPHSVEVLWMFDQTDAQTST